MAVSLVLVGLLYLATGIGLAALLSKPFRHRDKPSTEGFVLALTAAATNSVVEGLNLLQPDFTFSIAVWYVRVFGSAVATGGWLLLAAGFVSRRRPDSRLRAVLYGYCILFGGLMLVDWFWLPLADSIFVDTWGWSQGNMTVGVFPNVAFWVNAGINYLFLLAGTALFLVEISRTSGLRRRQTIVLALAAIPPTVTNVLIVFGILQAPYDITIFGFAVAVVLFTWALYRMSVLDLAPVARQTAMEEMDDAVVTLDTESRVIDCNAAARALFEIDETEYFGQPADECFPPALTESLQQYEDVEDVDTQLTVPLDGVERSLLLSLSPIRASQEADGRIVVLRDVTPLKRREEQLKHREEELDLLRQVFSRVLRHNLRNELTVIHGSATDLADRTDTPLSDQAETICEASEDLLAISQKARHIERIIDSDAGTVDRNLRTVAADAAETMRQRHPEATIEVTGPDCTVWCNAELEAAVENLIENAVEHNPSTPTVRVEISDQDGSPRLTVTDNGPGIAEEELVVLEEATETQLTHGSGIGLWLVKWVVDNSHARLSFDTDQDGTAVTIQFDEMVVKPGANA